METARTNFAAELEEDFDWPDDAAPPGPPTVMQEQPTEIDQDYVDDWKAYWRQQAAETEVALGEVEL